MTWDILFVTLALYFSIIIAIRLLTRKEIYTIQVVLLTLGIVGVLITYFGI